MKKRRLRKFSFLILLVFLYFFISADWAAAANQSGETPPTFKDAFGEVRTAGNAAYGETPSESLEEAAAKWIGVGLSLVGMIFLILMVYGGYIWMIARGEASEAQRAKEIIKMALIGLIVVVTAYALTRFVIDRLVAGGAGT